MSLCLDMILKWNLTWAMTCFCSTICSCSRELMAVIISYCFSSNVTVFTLSKIPNKCAWMVCESLAWPRISNRAGSLTKKKRGKTNLFFSRYLFHEKREGEVHSLPLHFCANQGPKYRTQDQENEKFEKIKNEFQKKSIKQRVRHTHTDIVRFCPTEVENKYIEIWIRNFEVSFIWPKM